MSDPKTRALEKMLGDMDDMEGNNMFNDPSKSAKGVDITISVIPKTDEEEMCKGGEAYSEGGLVEPEINEDELPPFLRKKKK